MADQDPDRPKRGRPAYQRVCKSSKPPPPQVKKSRTINDFFAPAPEPATAPSPEPAAAAPAPSKT